MNKTDLLNFYKTRQDMFAELLERDKKIISWLSFFRLLIFVGGIILSILLFRISNLTGFASLLLSMIIFGILLKRFTTRSWLKKFHSNMFDLNEGEINSLNEDYSQFADGSEYSEPSHEFSHDIDMFGKGSVFQSLNRTSTDRGEAMLAAWLLNPGDMAKSFTERSEAIRELSGKTDWRQKFSALGLMNLTSSRETESFYEWMNEESEFYKNKVLRASLILLPSLTIILFFLFVFSVISVSWFVIMFLINILLLSLNLARINNIYAKVTKKSSYLSVVSSLIEHIVNEEFDSSFLKEKKVGLSSDSVEAIARVKRLAQILQMFDSRLNMIMGVILNGVFLWDYQCVVRIEKWKIELAHLVPIWFDNIACFDAINSLAGYASNNPDFVYPSISDGDKFLDAEDMGHHLIPSAKRVTNNYCIPGAGAINIVTGANMAGKSTFLRTVAVNLVLAMCGAPVCASRFVFTPIDIFTSMRTSDSLSEEESYFFAELKRLKRLIDLLGEDRKPFFILDEILKGTNSKDKSEGSRAFLEKVIRLGGTGLIATHDISLGKLEENYPDKVSNNCFEIEIAKGKVSFDFILREGITSKMNAALLMRQQGIV